jgi:hypothetical protein
MPDNLGPHPPANRTAISAHLNDCAFHLKLAERALAQVELEFSGPTRSEIQQEAAQIRKRRRKILKAIEDAGVPVRLGYGSGNLKQRRAA